MKFTQKMALVPFDQAFKHSNQKSPVNVKVESTPRDILKERLQSLDDKMNSILDDSSLSIDEKVRRYNEVLEQYLLFADKFYERRIDERMEKRMEDSSDDDEDKTISQLDSFHHYHLFTKNMEKIFFIIFINRA